MATMYCALCNRPVEARRHIGGGTVILAVLTGGLWLVAIPFYRKRCCICKSAAVSHTPPDAATRAIGSATPALLSDMERRLKLSEADLEAASVELERVRTERDFYRDLLGDRVPSELDRPGA